jgi:hypothetical protein
VHKNNAIIEYLDDLESDWPRLNSASLVLFDYFLPRLNRRVILADYLTSLCVSLALNHISNHPAT